MSEMAPPLACRRPPSLLLACALLSAAVLVAYPLVALGGAHLLGRSIWVAAGVAAGVCWAASVLGLIAFHRFRLAGNPLAGMFSGMLIRLALPLALGVILTTSGSPLGADRVFELIVIFYLVTLLADTLLMVAMNRKFAADGNSRFQSRGGARG